MVKLEEVEDEAFVAEQPGPTEGEDDWDTDSESDLESDVSSAPPEETLSDRLKALQDIIPPSSRRFMSSTVDTTTSWIKSGFVFSGKALWVVSTSALLLGVPWALAYAEEQQMIEMEREMKMQSAANEMLTPGTQNQATGVKPAF